MGNFLGRRNMSFAIVNGGKNNLSLDDHVDRILAAQSRMRVSLYEFIDAIRDAYDQLPQQTFQNELGHRLGMKKSILSKWISIATSDYLRGKRDCTPATFSSLYVLTLIQKKYHKRYGDQSLQKIDRLIESGKITSKSERSDLECILSNITQKIREDERLKRQGAILALSGGRFDLDGLGQTIEEHLQNNARYRSFVITPPSTLMSRWKDNGYFSSDIAEEFPLHELRAPSMAETLIVLIKLKMKEIETGIKLINAWGFSYRDVVVPPSEVGDKCSVIDDSDVLVRGERGQRRVLDTKTCASFETSDVLDFAEQISSGPNILVFGTTNRTGWASLVQDQ